MPQVRLVATIENPTVRLKEAAAAEAGEGGEEDVVVEEEEAVLGALTRRQAAVGEEEVEEEVGEGETGIISKRGKIRQVGAATQVTR